MSKRLALKYFYYESLSLGFLPFVFSVPKFKFHMRPLITRWSYLILVICIISIIVASVLHVLIYLQNTPSNLIVLVLLVGQGTTFQLQLLPFVYQLLFKRRRLLTVLNKGSQMALHSFGTSLPNKLLKRLSLKLVFNVVCTCINMVIFSWMYGNRISGWLVVLAVFDLWKFMILSTIHFISLDFVATLVETSLKSRTPTVLEKAKKILDLYGYTQKLEPFLEVSSFVIIASAFVCLMGNVSTT